MKSKSPGISVVEAGLVLGLISIVCISMFLLLGENANNTFKQVNTKFTGYKPFGNHPQTEPSETSGIQGAPKIPDYKTGDAGETGGVPASVGKKRVDFR